MVSITDIEKAETIVKNNDSLIWNGWDIVQLKENSQAFMKRNAMFRNGKWYSTKTFALSETGWELPSAMIGKNNGLQVGRTR